MCCTNFMRYFQANGKESNFLLLLLFQPFLTSVSLADFLRLIHFRAQLSHELFMMCFPLKREKKVRSVLILYSTHKN